MTKKQHFRKLFLSKIFIKAKICCVMLFSQTKNTNTKIRIVNLQVVWEKGFIHLKVKNH